MFHCDVCQQGVRLMSRTTAASVPVHVKFTLNEPWNSMRKRTGLWLDGYSMISTIRAGELTAPTIWKYTKSLVATSWHSVSSRLLVAVGPIRNIKNTLLWVSKGNRTSLFAETQRQKTHSKKKKRRASTKWHVFSSHTKIIIFLGHTSGVALGKATSAALPLRFRLKNLNNYQMDLRDIWYRRPWTPEGKAHWLLCSLDFSSIATSRPQSSPHLRGRDRRDIHCQLDLLKMRLLQILFAEIKYCLFNKTSLYQLK